MQKSFRSLVSRCVGATGGGHLQDAAACKAWGVILDPSRFLSTLAQPGLNASTLTTCSRPFITTSSNNSSSASSPAHSGAAAAPRSCQWLMQLGRAPSLGAPDLLLPHGARAFAKPAKAAAAAPAAPSGPKGPRVSWTKLYSCRNDRLRHTHEQIWPTLQLTEAELAMFRRNSRLFVVEMGRSISLQTKYRMGLQVQDPDAAEEAGAAAAAGGGAEQGAADATQRKVPYQQARSLLYESQLHLDALGENPRYLKVRRVGSMFATKLQNVRKLRLLLGFRRRRFLQRMYEHALVCRGSHRMWKLVTAMEASPAMFVTRMGLVDDVVAGVRALRDDKLYINGRRPDMPDRGYMVPGDVVSPAAGSMPYFRQRVAKSLLPLESEVLRYVM